MIVERMSMSSNDIQNKKFHLDRYEWAVKIINEISISKQQSILDAACGTGYGTRMLSECANFTLGIDIANEALNEAVEMHNGSNLFFQKADLNQRFYLPYKFDYFVCFETIEHLESPMYFIENILNFLNSKAIVFISAPINEMKGQNPYHLHVFNQDSFKVFFEKHFEIIETFYQPGNISYSGRLK